jgi:tight adherence protein B
MNLGSIVAGSGVGLILWLLLPVGRKVRRLPPSGSWFRQQIIGKTCLKAKVTAPKTVLVFAEVVALLRIGLPAGVAWKRATGVAVDEVGVPHFEALSRLVGDKAAIAMTSASRLSVQLGAPLAAVLLKIQETMIAESEADADRKAAFAGPQTTARVLLGLPILGLLLGSLLGANPLEVVTSGGVGTAAVLAGVFLLFLGRWWISQLITQAQRSAVTGGEQLVREVS